MQFKVKGILSYPHLFQPRAVQQGDDPKFSASILVKKTDPQVQAILQIIETEKKNGWPTGFPANGRVFLKDGADPAVNKGDNRLAEYYIISGNAAADSRPDVVDKNLQPVMDPSAAIPGDIVWAAFNTFTYNTAVNKGVSAGLNAVMLTGELGELGRLDNRPSVDQIFGDIAGGAAPAAAPTAPVAAPAAPAVPAAPAAPAAPQFIMTDKAGGYTREQYLAANWTDAQLIEQGYMLPPGGATPSFVG